MSSPKKRKSFRPMELRALIDEVMRKNKWTQDDLGKKIGVTQSNVSKMRYGPDWKFHWEVFWRFLEICEESGIDPARGLEGLSETEVITHAEHRGKTTRSDANGGEKEPKAARSSIISKGRAKASVR